jgi:Cd2+/Zn2+-exporting ATPase
LANAICDHAEGQGLKSVAVRNTRLVPGKGVEATLDGETVFVGAPVHAAAYASLPNKMASRISELEAEGKTVAVLTKGTAAIGIIALRDEPRAGSAEGVAHLKKDGLRVVMMTGDNARTADVIAGKLGIEADAEMLPEDKADKVRAMAETQSVVMVGDGVNDAPALAHAQTGVAIGSGTNVALEAADAAIMNNDIRDLARMLRLSRQTMTNVRQNVFIALGLKAIFLVTTVTGISGLWMAVLADTGATVLVTLNAMRLLGALGPVGNRT